MTFNTTTVLLDRDGDAMEYLEKPMTLRAALLTAVDAQLPGDEAADGSAKMHLYRLGMTIHTETDVDLPAEDIALLKERVVKCFGPIVVGRVFELLDPVSASR